MAKAIKFKLLALLFLAGCSPLVMDMTISYGEQNMKKELGVESRPESTPAQVTKSQLEEILKAALVRRRQSLQLVH